MRARSSDQRAARLAIALSLLAVIATGGCSDDEVTFCEAVEDYNEAAARGGAVIDIDSSEPEAEVQAQVEAFEAFVEGQLEEQRSLLDNLRDTSPTAIREDVELLVNEALASGEALSAADFDIFAYADQHQLDAAEAEERLAANRRVADYTQRECGEPLVIAEVAAVPDETLAEIRESRPAVPAPPAPPDPPAPPEPPPPPEPVEPVEPPEPVEPAEPEEPEPGY